MDVYQISEAERCDTSAPRQRHISGLRTGNGTSGWNSSSPWVMWKETWSRHFPTWRRENLTWTREIPTCHPEKSDVACHVSRCPGFFQFRQMLPWTSHETSLCFNRHSRIDADVSCESSATTSFCLSGRSR